MKKQLFLFFLVLIFCFALAVPVAAKDITVTVSVEKFVLSQGYLVEPEQITVAEGTTGAEVITDLLGAGNYRKTGSLSDLYLSAIKDDSAAEIVNFPKYLLSFWGSNQDAVSSRTAGWLSEFDYSSQAGWMYCVNNSFPDVSCGQYILEDGDVMRWQFTLCGLGSDLGADNSNWGTDSLVITANKDALTAKVAEANAEANAATIKASKAYQNAVIALQNIEASQEKVNAALAALTLYLNSGTDATALDTARMETVPLKVGDDITIYAPPAEVKATGVTLDQTTLALTEGETAKLTATIAPANATNKTIIWGSDNMAVATVDSDGTVTAVAAGTANVVAKTNNNKVATCVVTVTAVPSQETPVEKMTDVVKGKWYYNDVAYCMAKGIIVGTSDTTFSPEDNITRGQFVTLFGRYTGVKGSSAEAPVQTKFSDVDATKYYASHVAWATENKIVYGTSETTFEPNAFISREDMATMMLRFANATGITLPDGSSVERFADDNEIAKYAKTAAYSMKAASIIKGKGGNVFAPKDNATRAETARMLHLLLEIK